MYGFKALMKLNDGFFSLRTLLCIPFEQIFHIPRNIFWSGRLYTTNFVGKTFVVANGKPILCTVGCT